MQSVSFSFERRLIFVDLETGGIDPSRHPIIQVAAIAADAETLAPVEAIELKLRFSASRALKHSLRKNSYQAGVWAQEALEPAVAAKYFAAFLRRHPFEYKLTRNGQQRPSSQLVAHNASFDGPFLEAWFEKEAQFLPINRPLLCTLQRAKWWFAEHALTPPANYQLATLCHYFLVPFHAAQAHDALGDVTATLGLYTQLRSAPTLCEIRNTSTNMEAYGRH